MTWIEFSSDIERACLLAVVLLATAAALAIVLSLAAAASAYVTTKPKSLRGAFSRLGTALALWVAFSWMLLSVLDAGLWSVM